ncbi:MAG: response regulator [Phycisphaeraceae bacterium]
MQQQQEQAGRAAAEATRAKVAPRRRARAAFRVLVVDPDAGAAGAVARACTGLPLRLEHVTTAGLAEASAMQRPVDLALVAAELPDRRGLALATRLRRRRQRTQVILTGMDTTAEDAIAAMRAGVLDVLTPPLDGPRLRGHLNELMRRRRRDRTQARRVRDLRSVCRKLDDARRQVSAQVDTLANDLVDAYEQLAGELEQAVHVGQYQALVRQELDLAPLLRKTLEYLLDHVGPCNAAVFLPASGEEYAVGAYVNYDCAGDAVEMLLEHLADTAVPAIAEHDQAVHVSDEATMRAMVGEPGGFLLNCEMLAFACTHEDETLAVLTLFRDRAEPFDAAALPTCDAVAQHLPQSLGRLIRVHHRTGMWDEE